MVTAHRFQTPHVEPLPAGVQDAEVMFRVTAAQAERIFRALDETSSHLAFAPNGSHVAASYRRLAAALRVQASSAHGAAEQPAPTAAV